VTTYGLNVFGPPNLYGPGRPATVYPGGPATPLISNNYLIDPFVAQAVDYASILLTWSSPDLTTDTPMTEFRLLSSRYGFPVDENDGLALLDTTVSPGVMYLDQNTIPGTMHYYAMYINSGTQWIRAGFAACLMPVNNGSGAQLLSWLPEYIRDADDNELTGGASATQQLVAPPVPAENVTLVSPYPFPVQVTLSGGSITDVLADGIDLGAATTFWLQGAGSVALQYGTAPAWSWANVPAGSVNQALASYLNIAGWGLDYLRTQYDYTLSSLNDPMTMPLSDLAALAGELGVPYQPEIPAYFMRKAVANWAVVMQQRGSLDGIAEHISLLTGYGADVQVANNIMLENDQSRPQHPRYQAWDSSVPYASGERVTYPTYPKWTDGSEYVTGNATDYNGTYYQYGGGSPVSGVPPVLSNGTLTSGWSVIEGPFFYSAAAATTSLPGTAPSGTTASNAAWNLVVDSDEAAPSPISEANSSLWASGPVSTWEVVYPAAGNTEPPASALVEGTGLPNPANLQYDFTQSTFRVYNRATSGTQDTWLRSVIRQVSDFNSGNTWFVPDPQLVVENGIPVPYANPATSQWNATTRYPTGSVVTYGSLNYVAQRASTGATPPQPGVPLNQNWDFESGITGWGPFDGGTLAQSSAYAYHGTHSMLVTPNGTTGWPGVDAEDIPVTPLGTYSFAPWVYMPVAWAGTVQVFLTWYDPWGVEISSSGSSAMTIPAATWTQVPVTAQAPASAVTVNLTLQINNNGATPPPATALSYWDLCFVSCTETPEWVPLGNDTGIPLMISARTMQNLLATTGTENFAVTPFVEWYDSWGNFIARVFSRTATAGTSGTPGSYAFDGFNTGPDTPLQGRTPDAGGGTWATQTGAFTVDGMGNAFPTTAGTKSLSTLTVASSCTLALTITDSPPSGLDSGLVFWYQSASSYWHAGMTGLWYWTGTAWSEKATYPTAGQIQAGDRVYVIVNQSGSSVTMQNSAGTLASPGIAVFRNTIGPYNSGTGSGLVGTVTPASGQYPTGGTSAAGIASEAV
jgi:hypothetical protein